MVVRQFYFSWLRNICVPSCLLANLADLLYIKRLLSVSLFLFGASELLNFSFLKSFFDPLINTIYPPLFILFGTKPDPEALKVKDTTEKASKTPNTTPWVMP
jgi:hypothetical protein